MIANERNEGIYCEVMEIPRNWREQSTRISFEGSFKVIQEETTGKIFIYFKYPGGEVPAVNAIDLAIRLERKGFGDNEIAEIVELFLNTVATEAAISTSKVLESVF